MENTSPIEIHETAFMTSMYRSSNPDLSKDPFAWLWNNPKTEKWVGRYKAEISELEPYLHCLRNRYFFEKINTFCQKNPSPVLINFGAGFSMYPFCVEGIVCSIEIDREEVVVHKKAKLQDFVQQGLLPKREIHFLSADFDFDLNDRLVGQIRDLVQGRPCFILLEGVLFFLNLEIAHQLFRLFEQIQHSGDWMGSVSFLSGAEHTAVFQRLIRFCQNQMKEGEIFRYLNLPHHFYQNLSAYQIVEQTEEIALSQKYDPHFPSLVEGQFLNEHMYILQKK